MNQYEVLYIINAGLDEEATKALIEKFSGVVTENGGVVDSIDEWGKRRLAYLIDDMSEGFYVLMKFQAKGEVPTELERNFKITDGVMRYLITRQDDN
ncbi:MAG: 30S ribosomal protein S6 [Christensenellales bacterium]|jgi:small subunit ribosomal protein S6